jgi:hypothetical protein
VAINATTISDARATSKIVRLILLLSSREPSSEHYGSATDTVPSSN